MRIFVVDDDRDLAESLAEVLELSGHEVEIAFSGEEAVEVFREKDFDVSFMDVVMPGMNGVESFLEIRKIKPDAKVFMLTGYSVAQLLEQAIENGALGVLEKPIGIEELLAKIDEMKQEGMVLVADDDPAFRDSLVDVLSQQGYTVCVASTGQEAVERVMAGGIDLLALDLRLPVLSGLEVYLELKKRGHAVPTVIMSGHLNEESEAVSALCDMSVTGILTKPFDPAHLIAALNRIAPAAKSAPAATDATVATPDTAPSVATARLEPVEPPPTAAEYAPIPPVSQPRPVGEMPSRPDAARAGDDATAMPRGRAAAVPDSAVPLPSAPTPPTPTPPTPIATEPVEPAKPTPIFRAPDVF